jgi:hypothetical protein
VPGDPPAAPSGQDPARLLWHTSTPQPEPRENPALTVNGAPRKTVLTLNDA